MRRERRRRGLALAISLLVHALLLSLVIGGQGTGLPGFGLPWQERRAEAAALRVVIVPKQAAAPTPVPAITSPAPVAEPPPPARVAPVAAPVVTAPVAAAPVAPEPAADTRAKAVTLPAAPAMEAPARPAAAVITAARPDDTTWAVPPMPVQPAAAPPEPTGLPQRDAADTARERALEQARLEQARQAAQQQADQLAAARAEAARLEAERQEAVRRESTRQEAARLEAARLDATRSDNARLDAERQELARQAAAKQEAARQESARQEAARQDAARQESARQEAARQEAARAEAARAEAARAQAAQALQAVQAVQAVQDAAAAREAKLRAIGRQLDEEAARRDAAARQSPSLLPSASSARRGRLFGRSDPNAALLEYAEAWSRKIQLNLTFDQVREAVKQAHSDPLVTVALRSDGSVESISFVRSSGVPAIDEAIRRVVQGQAPYPAFPPALAREFDVVEIRRSWHFDMAIRLY